MSRKKKELPVLENVTILDVVAGGKALARVDNLVIFVPYCVPGDVVDLKICRKKNSYAEAKVINYREKSPNHIAPFCEHFGICGGCQWQILPYTEQLKYKQKQVENNLTHIGKIELPEISPILASAKTTCYRNKVEFTFSNKRWLTEAEIAENVVYDDPEGVGFHISGGFDKILNIEKCYLMDNINNRLRNHIHEYAEKEGFEFYNIRSKEGMLRDMVIRTANTGELMLIMIAQILNDEELAKFKTLLDHIIDTFPEITSLQYIINNKCNDSYLDLDTVTYKGKDHITAKMEDLQFKVSPKAFYQTNTDQAYVLYKVARDFAGLTGKEMVYDLYTGTGTIANFVASKASHVIGIEYVPEAIEDAKVNAQINNIANAEFFAGDMKDILTDEFIAEHGHPDVIISDPPRAGMHEDVIEVILNARPDRIVYVSCNPATQARDLHLLDPLYKVSRVQPVDMFPQTLHVENVVLLTRREDNE